MNRYYDLAPKRYTIVDANGDHFGYGRTEDANQALRDAERLNSGAVPMADIATGDPELYVGPFVAVAVLNESGRTGAL